ncbi:MAG TPA: hypothetical protein PLB97_00565, partial [Accumulibacter sp.]|nr:hypothetical protein [Accumulibacter sp.]
NDSLYLSTITRAGGLMLGRRPGPPADGSRFRAEAPQETGMPRAARVVPQISGEASADAAD